MIRRFFIALLCLSLLLPCCPGRAAAPEPPDDTVWLPIIMYHEVKNTGFGKDVISPWEFESDLKYLARNSYSTITMDDLSAWFHSGAALPPNPIMLTFDDGYLSTYEYVLPLLKKYGAKIVLSLIVKDTDDFTRCGVTDIDFSHVTWTQLVEMQRSGLVEVQNHSYNLHAVKNGRYGCVRKKGEPFLCYEQVLKTDVLKAQDEILAMTGRCPTTFTYPYGRYNDETDDILRTLGIEATLSCRYGINVLTHQRSDLYRLRRLCRSHGTSLGALMAETYRKIRRPLPGAPSFCPEPTSATAVSGTSR